MSVFIADNTESSHFLLLLPLQQLHNIKNLLKMCEFYFSRVSMCVTGGLVYHLMDIDGLILTHRIWFDRIIVVSCGLSP